MNSKPTTLERSLPQWHGYSPSVEMSHIQLRVKLLFHQWNLKLLQDFYQVLFLTEEVRCKYRRAVDKLEKVVSYAKQFSKVEVFSHKDTASVWREMKEAFDPEITVPTMRHGGRSMMLWGGFSASETGTLVKEEIIMKKEKYVRFLRGHLKTWWQPSLNTCLSWWKTIFRRRSLMVSGDSCLT